ncbi:epoxyqueuosine reductase QueH [Candidatus Gracilibacteria bacterium]|nr:epoxyqueuosine reductase QueH [Candidatus Gracilibacteria bacterium]
MIYILGGAFDPPHAGHSAIVRSVLHYKNPEKIIIIPSGQRDDKSYTVSDEQRLAMLDIFVGEIADIRIIIDDFFLTKWEGNMITRDVDLYARGKYGEDICHIFGTDTIESMSEWDSEQYAAKTVYKLFVPRSVGHDHEVGNDPEKQKKIPNDDWIASYLVRTEKLGILNFEFLTEANIPDISSTEIRRIIPEYATIHARFDEDPRFIIPGLSRKISRYILENKLYLTKSDKKPKILVHVCCGPDVTMPIIQLRDDYDIICFWYDPNIQPKSEYDKRYEAFVRICEIENIPYIKGAYDVGNFFTRIRGVEHTPERGEKCTYCYDMRMMVSAKLAKRLKIPLYTSSLNTSPKKDLDKLFKMGHKYGEKYGVEFLDIPFRKHGGFEKSVEYTREHDIYRQNYCGCIYSIREGGESEMKKRIVG